MSEIDHAVWLREQAGGPMSQNPAHAATCTHLTACADKIEQLQAVVDAVNKYIKLKNETERPTPEQWAEYEVRWQTIVRQATRLAAKAKGKDDGLSHAD